MEILLWILFILWLLIALFLLWLVGFTEFSYFGNKGIQFLYNLFSPIYNLKWIGKKYSSQKIQNELFLNPLESHIKNSTNPKVLDLACGTGRMSLMLLEQAWFNASIEAVDFSEGMLKKFRASLKKLDEAKQARVKIVKTDLSESAYWEDKSSETYDLVTLMEVGEFLPGFVGLLEQVSRVLKPGGLFMLTKPPEWMAVFYPGRQQSKKELTALLYKLGFKSVEIKPWTERYEIVYAIKGGT